MNTTFTEKAIRGALTRSLIRASRHADWIGGSTSIRAEVLLRELSEDGVAVRPIGEESEERTVRRQLAEACRIAEKERRLHGPMSAEHHDALDVLYIALAASDALDGERTE